MYVPLDGTPRLLPALFCRTRPLPARLLTMTEIGYGFDAQVMATETFAFVTVPAALAAAVQVCQGPVGWVLTVTLYRAPLETGAENVNAPEPASGMSPPPLFCSTRPLPMRPLTVPPMRYEFVLQLIVTVVTLALTTVPVPPPTLQVWVGPDGCVLIVTA